MVIANNSGLYARTDDQGNLILPPEIAVAYGLKPNTRLLLQKGINGLGIVRPVTQLSKLYIEVTNECTLNCRTCMRNMWNEPMGKMTAEVFSKVIAGLRQVSPPPMVFFGGFGEPLLHPEIVEMVIQAKNIGCPVELITNGTLLTPEISKALLEAGIDALWISIDGATTESYGDVRVGATLPKVIENLTQLNSMIYSSSTISCCSVVSKYKTELGFAFVAMKRNIADLPAVIRLGQRLNVRNFIVTNVLPYTPEMCDDVLYNNIVDTVVHPSLTLPRIDTSKVALDPLYREVNRINWIDSSSGDMVNRCPFINKGAAAIGWDGDLSSCLPLLHTNTSYVRGVEHVSKSWSIGNIKELPLDKIWNAPEHLAFRERVQAFDFAPCTNCGSCELFENNEEDCYNNKFPTCGGCLWAQGIIQCP
jgi:MoaA/NifB/PqqE/SkfB family radical SAM enzyme